MGLALRGFHFSTDLMFTLCPLHCVRECWGSEAISLIALTNQPKTVTLQTSQKARFLWIRCETDLVCTCNRLHQMGLQEQLSVFGNWGQDLIAVDFSFPWLPPGSNFWEIQPPNKMFHISICVFCFCWYYFCCRLLQEKAQMIFISSPFHIKHSLTLWRNVFKLQKLGCLTIFLIENFFIQPANWDLMNGKYSVINFQLWICSCKFSIVNLLIGICKLVNCGNPGGERREGFAKWRFGSAPAFTASDVLSDSAVEPYFHSALFSLGLILTKALFYSAPASAITASDGTGILLQPESYFHSAFSKSIWKALSNQ